MVADSGRKVLKPLCGDDEIEIRGRRDWFRRGAENGLDGHEIVPKRVEGPVRDRQFGHWRISCGALYRDYHQSVSEVFFFFFLFFFFFFFFILKFYLLI